MLLIRGPIRIRPPEWAARIAWVIAKLLAPLVLETRAFAVRPHAPDTSEVATILEASARNVVEPPAQRTVLVIK